MSPDLCPWVGLQAYSQSGAILLACGLSMGLMGFRPDAEFVGGAVLVITSVYLYARFPPPPLTAEPAAPATNHRTPLDEPVKSKDDYAPLLPNTASGPNKDDGPLI